MARRLALATFPLPLIALAMCGTGQTSGSGAPDGGRDDSTSTGSESGSGSGDGNRSEGETGSGGSSSGGDAGGDAEGDAEGGDGGPAIGASVLQFHNHASRDGVYVDALITKTAASSMHMDPTFNATVDGNVYAQPLYVENGPGGKGVFIVVTENNNVYALDENGASVWMAPLGTPAAQAEVCGNIQPLGITGTPVVDLTRRAIYLDAALPGTTTTNLSEHSIHALWA